MIRFSKRRGGRGGLFAPLPASPPRPRPAARRSGGLGELTEPVQLPVLTVQQQLRRAGYNVGRLDGRWGPTTENAFKRFLRSIGYVSGEQLPLEIDYERQLASIEVAIWNRLTSASPGAGGETTRSGSSSRSSSGSGSGSSSGSGSGGSGSSGRSGSSGSGGRTTTSSPTSSNARSGAADEGGAWWQSPWLWGAVALAAGAGVVWVATREPEPEQDEELEDEELLPAF